MRITYRYINNKKYWKKRWEEIPVDKPMYNTETYPLKYSSMIIKNNDGKILEAGCGNGRILRYYHNNRYDIIGIDFIDIAINKLIQKDPTLNVEFGDITKLRFKKESFKYILAFGLYHNLEKNLESAIIETYRILQNNGKICVSFRSDNIQNRITDWLKNRNKTMKNKDKNFSFHKINLTKNEFSSLFSRHGFKVEKIFPVENMPILYKFTFFRYKSHKVFNENIARSEGYRLSFIGNIFQKILMTIAPNQFCNIYVLIATKN